MTPATSSKVALFSTSTTSNEFQLAPTINARAGTKVAPITNLGTPIQFDFWNEVFTCPFHPRAFSGEARIGTVLNLPDRAATVLRHFEETLRAFVTKHSETIFGASMGADTVASRHVSILRTSRDGHLQGKFKVDSGGRNPVRIWTNGGKDLRALDEVTLDGSDIQVVAVFRGIWISSDGQWGANALITDMLMSTRTPICPWNTGA